MTLPHINLLVQWCIIYRVEVSTLSESVDQAQRNFNKYGSATGVGIYTQNRATHGSMTMVVK